MPTLGIRKSAWEAGTPDQRKVLRLFGEFVDIGQPALYQTGGGVEYYVADDWRYAMHDAAWFGKILSLLQQFDVIPDEMSRAEIRAKILQWIDNHGGIVIPATIPEGEDPYDYTYQQNGGPAFAAFRSQVPPGLTPVGG